MGPADAAVSIPTLGPAATLAAIVAATALGGAVSVLLAALLTRRAVGHLVPQLVSLSVGVLLGTALLHVLPEAFEGGRADAHVLFATLLGGLLFFFLLEKAELYRHGHHHEGDGHHHHAHFDAEQAGRGGLAVLVGDSIHNFCDGLIIAAAFVADARLGVVTATAIVLHEIPQELGDTIVLLNAGFSRAKALAYNALAGLAAVVGGVVGYVLAAPLERWQPHLLVVASSSLVYIAVADLLPQLQRRLPWRANLTQLALIAAGLAIVALARSAGHAGH